MVAAKVPIVAVADTEDGGRLRAPGRTPRPNTQPARTGFKPGVRPDGVGKCSCGVMAVLWIGRCIACFERGGGDWSEP